MSLLKDFLIFCSGAEPSILRRCPSETNKYAGIGATILFTGIFASIAAGFALASIFENSWVTGGIALMWGLMIFNLDRYIVSTMRKKASKWSEFKMAFPRIILALLISIVIAKPLELKIFESEIEVELVKMKQEQYKIQEDLVKARYQSQIDSLESKVAGYKNEIAQDEQHRDALNLAAIAEADGTGGSRNKNLGPIYKTKKAATDVAQQELDQTIIRIQPMIDASLKQLEKLTANRNEDLSQLERSSLTGFAAQIEGLDRAAKRSQSILIANIFIMLLFIAIETAPLMTKLMVDAGPYDFEMRKHEELFELNFARISSQRNKEIKSQIEFDNSTTLHKTKQSILAENELSDEMIRRRLEELKKKAELSPAFLKKSTLFSS